MTHRGPFQPLPVCDSVIPWLKHSSDIATSGIKDRLWREHQHEMGLVLGCCCSPMPSSWSPGAAGPVVYASKEAELMSRETSPSPGERQLLSPQLQRCPILTRQHAVLPRNRHPGSRIPRLLHRHYVLLPEKLCLKLHASTQAQPESTEAAHTVLGELRVSLHAPCTPNPAQPGHCLRLACDSASRGEAVSVLNHKGLLPCHRVSWKV